MVSESQKAIGPSESDRLILVSWNVRFALKCRRAAELLATHEVLSRAGIILLQEMDEPGTTLIAERLGFDWRYAPASIHPQTGRPFGNAVLSPHPLGDFGVVDLPHQARISGQPRMALVVPVSVNEKPVLAISVHTEIPALGPSRRRAQFATIAEGVQYHLGAEDIPVVVGGDFNTLTRLGLRRVEQAMARFDLTLLSADAGPTLYRRGRGFRLDHIFGRGVNALGSGSVDGSCASDHDPIWVELGFDQVNSGVQT